jgi:hypothetical protein
VSPDEEIGDVRTVRVAIVPAVHASEITPPSGLAKAALVNRLGGAPLLVTIPRASRQGI